MFDRDAPFIELVTSPNNPDGRSRQAVVNRDGGKAAHDLAYYWPQYTPITAAANHDLMLCTVSKSMGHAGTRIGWALVKDSQLRATKIVRTIREGYKGSLAGFRERFFDHARRIMIQRWDRLRDALRQNPIFSLPEFLTAFCNFVGGSATSQPAFAWL